MKNNFLLSDDPVKLEKSWSKWLIDGSCLIGYILVLEFLFPSIKMRTTTTTVPPKTIPILAFYNNRYLCTIQTSSVKTLTYSPIPFPKPPPHIPISYEINLAVVSLDGDPPVAVVKPGVSPISSERH